MVLAGVLVLACWSDAYAQSANLTGVVTDARTGRPLSGVLVSIENQPLFVETDAEGRYGLTVPPGKHVLTVSLIGYAMLRQAIEITAEAPLSLAIVTGARCALRAERTKGPGTSRSIVKISWYQGLVSASVPSRSKRTALKAKWRLRCQ